MNRRILERKRILYIEKNRIIECLVKRYSPVKIILFCSLDHDDINEGSDIDLLIIKLIKDRLSVKWMYTA